MKATRDPGNLAEADLAPLRAHGIEDVDLLTLLHVIGFFNSINRIADGLGVDPEP